MNRWFHPEFETDLIDAARYYQGQPDGVWLCGRVAQMPAVIERLEAGRV